MRRFSLGIYLITILLMPSCFKNELPSSLRKPTVEASSSSSSASSSQGYDNRPLTPHGLVAYPLSTSEILLLWKSSYSVRNYTVEIASFESGPFLEMSPALGPTETTKTINVGLSNTTFYFRVIASNEFGKSPAATAFARTYAAGSVYLPLNFVISASPGSATTIDLKWRYTASSTNTFVLERSNDSAFATSIVLESNLACSRSEPDPECVYQNTGLVRGTQYCYRIKARQDTLYSSTVASVPACLTIQAEKKPDIPTLHATVNSAQPQTKIDLSWNDVSDETGYRLQRSSDLNFTTIDLDQGLSAGSITYANIGLSAGMTYYYRIAAYNDAYPIGVAQFSWVVTIATKPNAPAAPTNFTATPVSSTQIDLSWTDTTGGKWGFKLQRGLSATGIFDTVKTLTAGITTYQDTSLTPDKEYFYRVLSFNEGGDSGFAAAGPAPVLAAPTLLALSDAITFTTVTLGWKDNSVLETGFAIQRSTDGIAWSDIGTTLTDALKFSDDSIDPRKTYKYRVKATGGGSGYSNVLDVNTVGVDPEITYQGGITPVGGVTRSSKYVSLSSNLVLATGGIGSGGHPSTYTLDIHTLSSPAIKQELQHPSCSWGSCDNNENSLISVMRGSFAFLVRVDGGLYSWDLSDVGSARECDHKYWGTGFGVDVTQAMDGGVMTNEDSLKTFSIGREGADAKIYVGDSIYIGSPGGKVHLTGTGLALVTHPGTSTLSVVDLHAKSVEALDTGGANVNAVKSSGNYAYISTGDKLVIADISNPSHPVKVKEISLSDTRGLFYHEGGFVFVARGSGGFSVIDVVDPSNPKLVKTIPTKGECNDIVVSNRKIITADSVYLINTFEIK